MKKLKLSMFTVVYPINKNEVMLYNTLTSAGGVISKLIFKKIKNGNIEDIDNDILNTLINNGFIVYAEENETATYWCFYQRVKYHSVYDEFHIAFLPTYKCNFKCVYCFEDRNLLNDIEDENKEQIIKSLELVSWIGEYYQKFRFKRLGIVFYGGEPLLFKERLLEYIRDISLWTKKMK